MQTSSNRLSKRKFVFKKVSELVRDADKLTLDAEEKNDLRLPTKTD